MPESPLPSPRAGAVEPTRSSGDPGSSNVPHQRQWHIVALFVGIVLLQLALGAISVDVLSAVRAYVGGESLWSKAQKEAWFFSTRYGESRAEDDYRRFRESLAIPLGDRRAREELDRPQPDAAVAGAGFLAGGNDAEDVAGMIRLYRWFHGVSFMADAIAIWAEADARLAELAALVEQAHEHIDARDFDAAVVHALPARLSTLNEQLTALERQFSARLGDASRRTRHLLVLVNLTLAALMTGAGLSYARRSLREQVLSDRALRESHQRWDVAAEAAAMGLFDWRLADGRFALDARGCALLGIASTAPCTIAASELETMVHVDDAARIRAAIRLAAAEAKPVALRAGVTGRDGVRRHLELIGVVDEREASAGRRVAGILRDVTDDVQAEQLRLDKLAAERASLAKSEFLARVSHELRTPLNAILGFGQLMQLDNVERLSAMQAQRVQHILHGGQHLLRLVEDILSLTSLESGQARPTAESVALAGVVEASLRQVAFMADERGVRMETVVPPGEVVVRGDAVRLEQVLVNLLTNAVKYGRAGGRVAVAWHAQEGFAELSVRDTGAGLAPEQVGQLFQPFNRLGAEYTKVEGVGLGLVIVRELTERIGGSVGASSEPGVGSCFVVKLPLASAAMPEKATVAATTVASPMPGR